MKFVRFAAGGSAPRWGVVLGGEIVPLRRDPFHDFRDDLQAGTRIPLAQAKLLAPVKPGKIIGVGMNYTDHAAEMGTDPPAVPVIFYKDPSAVIGPGEAIVLPPVSHRVDYEAELGVVIGREARRVPREKALEHVLGYTCLNDVTARDLQKQDGQWTRAKSYPTFCPVGPWVMGGLDPERLTVELQLNGETKQLSATDRLCFSVADLIAFISGVMPLLPGDVIATGTPVGVGQLQAGDRVTVIISEIGELENPVVREGVDEDEREV